MAILGIYLEEKSTAKADKPIKKLMELFPESATIIIDDAEKQADISDITPGDLVLVKPGESFPCDGVIEAGRASVVEAMFTGENMPVDKSVSDRVFAGTLNTMGFATVRVQRVGEDTSLARIIRSVSQISDSKKTVVGMTRLYGDDALLRASGGGSSGVCPLGGAWNGLRGCKGAYSGAYGVLPLRNGLGRACCGDVRLR